MTGTAESDRYPRGVLPGHDNVGVGALNRQFAPDRHVVRWLLAATHMLVDLAGFETIGSLRRQENVIDADAVVFLPGTGLIIPKRILMRLGMAGAEGFRV